MIGRIFSDRRRIAILRRVDRPAAVLIAVLQAIVAAVGWFAVEPVVLAICVAAQLALGGIAAAYVIGPARPDSGFARYAMPAVAGIAATVFGRLIPGGTSILLVPIVAVLLWSVTYLELRIARGTGGRTIQNLLLTGIVFTGAWGLLAYFGAEAWPSPILLLAVLTVPLALRAAEARGVLGAEAFGQSLLHVLVVIQVGLAVSLLNVQLQLTAAIIALSFYTWAGAAEALRGDAPGRAVALEFGSLVLIGLVAGLLLHRP